MDTSHTEFLALTHKYRGLIVRAIRRGCGAAAPHLLPDVEQEVYLALWQQWQKGTRLDYPVSYLYTVALRTALAILRTSRAPDRAGHTPPRHAPAAMGSTVADLSVAERACLLTELLDQLAPEQAQAVRAYLAGFSHTETAVLYGWSAAVARHRIYRGMHALHNLVRQASI